MQNEELRSYYNMKRNIDIHDRLLAFSIRIVKLCKLLAKSNQDRIIADQLLRAATSVGANMSEADAASSKRDFIHKVNIAKKEIMETNYWLKIIQGTGIIDDGVRGFHQILSESEQLIRIIGSILFRAKDKQ